ncbi:MAG: SDR family oxidoreductase [Pseudomonadota bacterium]
MELKGNTILITGGSSGIGMAIAARFIELGNEVIVTGRRASALEEFKAKYPSVHTLVNDAGKPADRVALAGWATREFPRLNVVINNAGIQRKVSLHEGEPWADTAQEIEINLAAPIHLAALFVPHLRLQPKAQIMNVSSGLAFVPLAHMPVYCATKAALHSFTMSLREQLKATTISVTEIIPPAVKTNLGGSHDFGEELADYVDSVFTQLSTEASELTFGFSGRSSQMSRADMDQLFQRMNSGSPPGAPPARK